MLGRWALLRAFGAIFQVTFLHGFVLLRRLDKKTWISSPLQAVFYAFAASLTVNYFLFFFFGVFRGPLCLGNSRDICLLCIFAYEAFLFTRMVCFEKGKSASVWTCAGILSLVSPLVIFAIVFYVNRPLLRIFVSDEIYSYNRWAMTWAEGKLPTYMNQYGQVVSTGWGAIIAALGSGQVAFVTKLFMPLFAFYSLIAMWDLWRNTRKKWHFLSIFTLWIFLALTLWQRSVIFVGGENTFYADLLSFTSMNIDMAVAFFSLLAFCSLLFTENEPELGKLRLYLGLGQLSAIAAGLTKQAGIFIVVLYPLLAYVVVLRKKTIFSRKMIALVCTGSLLVGAACLAPHYLYNEWSLRHGQNSRDNIADIHRRVMDIGPTPLSRIVPSYQSLYPFFYSKYLLGFAIMLALIGMISDLSLFVLGLCLVFPYALIWMMFVSYEITNLTVAIVFFALLTAKGISVVVSLFFPGIEKTVGAGSISPGFPSRKICWAAGALALMCMMVCNFFFPLDRLQSIQMIFDKTHSPQIYGHPVSEYFMEIGRIPKAINTRSRTAE